MHKKSNISKIKKLLLLMIFFGVNNIVAGVPPNILIIMVDDMGYSDIGCYGGEIETPCLDKLANQGIRYTQMYNTSKCNTSRESLLCGKYVTRDTEHKNFASSPTISEILKKSNYKTFMVGKNHNGINPLERGFDKFMGLQGGLTNYFCPSPKMIDGTPVAYTKTSVRKWMVNDKWVDTFTPSDPNFYTTDAFTDVAIDWLQESEKDKEPFFLYMAFNAPHNPLQAPADVVEKYKGKFDEGFQAIRKKRYKKMLDLGVIKKENTSLHPVDISEWSKLSEKEKEYEAACMEVYAACIDKVDENIDRVIKTLERQGKLKNTLVLFMSDNGAERVRGKEHLKYYHPTGKERLGGPQSFLYLGKDWCQVANTPFNLHKKTSHEGGIRTPLIAFWPKGIKAPNRWNREPIHLVDVMSTILEITGEKYPNKINGVKTKANDGISLLPSFLSKPLAKREIPIGNDYKFGKMLRDGEWKLVSYKKESWELYNMKKDQSETNNVSSKFPGKVKELEDKYYQWKKNSQKGIIK